MSDKNIYKRLAELCSEKRQLEYGSTISHADEDLFSAITKWIENNVDMNKLATELFSPGELANIKHYKWTKPAQEARSRIFHIMWDEVGNELVNKEGKLNVRFKKLLRSKYKVQSITPDDYCKISTIIGDWKEKMRLRYEIVDRLNWEQGDFGDGGSCYWSDRAAARDTLEYYHSFAVLFYKANENGKYEGVGRAWIAPILHRRDSDGAVVIFNRYGVPRDMKDVVAAITKIDHTLIATKVYLVNEGTSHDILYANGDAWVISYDEYNSDKLDLQYHIHYGTYDDDCNNDRAECNSCGRRINEDDVHNVGDDILCENCYENHAGYCTICDESFYNDDLNTIAGSGDRICDHCVWRYDYVQCADCDDYAHPDNAVETTAGRKVCDSCASNYTECGHCEKLIDTQENDHVNEATIFNHLYQLTYTSTIHLCDDCVDDQTYECEACHKTIYDSSADESITTCPYCKAKEISVQE